MKQHEWETFHKVKKQPSSESSGSILDKDEKGSPRKQKIPSNEIGSIEVKNKQIKKMQGSSNRNVSIKTSGRAVADPTVSGI